MAGYIDKYMGDGIMVIFGLDRTAGSEHARLAVSAARSIVGALPEFNQYMRTHFNHEFKIGVGIHSGTGDPGKPGFSQEEGIHRSWRYGEHGLAHRGIQQDRGNDHSCF